MPPPRRVRKGVVWDSEEEEVAKRPRRVGKGLVSNSEEEEEEKWEWAMANRPLRGRKGWDSEEEAWEKGLHSEEESSVDEEEFLRRLASVKPDAFRMDSFGDDKPFTLLGLDPLQLKGLLRSNRGAKPFCNGVPARKLRVDDPFRNPGDPFKYGKISGKFDHSKKKLHIFVRSAERALEKWNENHEGDDLELVEVVSGATNRCIIKFGHFNFMAKPKGCPDDKDVRLFFAEVKIDHSPSRPPNVVSWITTCFELKEGSMINCCRSCRPKHEVYHPFEFVPHNYDELSEHYRRGEEYEQYPVKIA